MGLQTEINTLKTSIANIKTEIINKNVEVADNDSVATYPAKIDKISNLSTGEYSKDVLKDVVEGTIEYLYDEVLVYIRPYCFTGCERLYKARFTNLRKICRNAFENCFALTTLVLDTPETYDIVVLEHTNAFKNTYINTDLGRIYVTDALLEKYQADSMWSKFLDKIKPISTLYD